MICPSCLIPLIPFTDSLTGDAWWGCPECHATQAADSNEIPHQTRLNASSF